MSTVKRYTAHAFQPDQYGRGSHTVNLRVGGFTSIRAARKALKGQEHMGIVREMYGPVVYVKDKAGKLL